MVKDNDKEVKNVLLRVTPEFHKKLRILAAKEEMNMTELIIDLVEKRYEEVIKRNGG